MNTKAEEFKFQFITNQWSIIPLDKQVEEVCKAGCRWIQLRLKDTPYEQWLQKAIEIRAISKKYDATFIVNDNVEIALKTDADGVHVGKEDMNPEKARELLGNKKITGATANTLNDILELYDKGIDYIGLGPYRETQTKDKLSPVLGIHGYNRIISELRIRNISIPIIAIGGIKLEDVGKLTGTGISGIAVSSLITDHEDPYQMTSLLLKKIYSLC